MDESNRKGLAAETGRAAWRRGAGVRRTLFRRVKRMKRQLWALYLAFKDPGTPALARIVIICAVGYAASPIDLIPDFIPVFGQLDDLLIVPLLITLALRLIPKDVAARCRREAWKHLAAGERVKTPAAAAAAVLFIILWLAFAARLLRTLSGR